MPVQFAEPYRITTAAFYRMVEVGIIDRDDRLELIEGEIVRMTPAGSRHAGCVKRIVALLGRRLGEQAILSVQDPLRLSDISEPEPDVAVLHPRRDFYADSHPGPADALIVIEVADSSLAYDRDEKALLYAHYGIPEYWLVDLAQTVVLVHSVPTDAGYKSVEANGRRNTWRSHSMPSLTLSGTDIFGSA